MVNKLMSRSRRLAVSVIGTFVIKGLALVVSFLTMPAYFRFFNDQPVLGVWLTVFSIASWILTFDLGIGNGLRNKLVEAIIEKSFVRCSELISSSYCAIGIISAGLLLVGLPLISIIPWNGLLNISEKAVPRDCFVLSMQIILIGIAIQLFLKTINAILYALQKPATNNAIALITSFLLLIWVLVSPSYGEGRNLLMVSVAYSIISNVPLFICTIVVFLGPMRNSKPGLRHITFRVMREVTFVGFSFLWAQVMFMFLISANEIIMSIIYGPEYVVEYQVYNKVFGLVASLVSLGLTPLWSQITHAQFEHDYTWISKVYKMLHFGIIAVFLIQVILAINAQLVIDVWIGESQIVISDSAIIVFVLYGTIYAWQSAESTLACGMGRLRVQNIIYSVTTPVRLCVIIALAMINLPWYQIIVVNAVTLLIYCIAQWIQTSKIISDNIKEPIR